MSACPNVPGVWPEVSKPGKGTLEKRREGVWARTGILGDKLEISPVPLGRVVHDVVEAQIVRRRFDGGFVEFSDELVGLALQALLLPL